MRSGPVIWGVAMILAAAVLLLDVLDVVAIDSWRVIGFLFLALLGAWVVGGIAWGLRSSEAEPVTIPLHGAVRATVEIEHNAGRLVVGAGERTVDLLAGTFAGGLEQQVRQEGNALRASLRPAGGGARFPLPRIYRRRWLWTVGLHPEIPIALKIEEEGGDARIDLRELRVTNVAIDARAGAVEVTMPARAGRTDATVMATAGAVSVHIPEGVACGIQAAGGLVTLLVDCHRFPRVDQDRYESPGYETAARRVDLFIDTVVGTVTVR